jgi:hypothetical protein
MITGSPVPVVLAPPMMAPFALAPFVCAPTAFPPVGIPPPAVMCLRPLQLESGPCLSRLISKRGLGLELGDLIALAGRSADGATLSLKRVPAKVS